MKKIKSYKQFIKESESFDYNDMIDYTLLEDSSTEEDLKELCEKANKLGVKSVCVLPKFVKLASNCLADSKVLVCTVVSFPGGDNSLDEKISETKKVIADGADEVDMVLNYKMLQLDGETSKEYLVEEVKSLADICHDNVNKDGEKVSALRFETEEKIYLIKMSIIMAEQLIEDDEDYDDDGNLTDDAREEYEDEDVDLDLED